MPDNALYWYGYESSDLEDLSAANGWGLISSRSYVAPTHNTNSISVLGTSNTNAGIGKKSKGNIGTAHVIMKSTTYITPYGLRLGVFTSKTIGSAQGTDYANQTNQNTIEHITKSGASDTYCYVLAATARGGDVYALWYE